MQWWPKRSNCTTILFYKTKEMSPSRPQTLIKSRRSGKWWRGGGGHRSEGGGSRCALWVTRVWLFLQDFKSLCSSGISLGCYIKGPLSKTVWDNQFSLSTLKPCLIRWEKPPTSFLKYLFFLWIMLLSSMAGLAPWRKPLQKKGF